MYDVDAETLLAAEQAGEARALYRWMAIHLARHAFSRDLNTGVEDLKVLASLCQRWLAHEEERRR